MAPRAHLATPYQCSACFALFPSVRHTYEEVLKPVNIYQIQQSHLFGIHHSFSQPHSHLILARSTGWFLV